MKKKLNWKEIYLLMLVVMVKILLLILFIKQEWIFYGRQMYFLLIHLRQPIKCAEKSLSYIIISNANIEKRIQARHSKLMSSNSNNSSGGGSGSGGGNSDSGSCSNNELYRLINSHWSATDAIDGVEDSAK